MELISASRIAEGAAARRGEPAVLARRHARGVGRGDVLERRPRPHHASRRTSSAPRSWSSPPTAASPAPSTRTCCKEARSSPSCSASEGKEVVSYLVGRKAVGYFPFRRRESVRDWVGGTDNPEFETAQGDRRRGRRARSCSDTRRGRRRRDPHRLQPLRRRCSRQTPEVVRLLPLEVVEGVEEPDERRGAAALRVRARRRRRCSTRCCPSTSSSRIFNAMLAVGRQPSTRRRQQAMKAASDNADTLIRDYTRLANNARQPRSRSRSPRSSAAPTRWLG